MIELTELTAAEAKHFANKLDAIVKSEQKTPRKQEVINALKNYHKQGMMLLIANNAHHLKDQRLKIFTKLGKRNIQKMPLTRLRHYAKRLGVPNATTKNTKDLKSALVKQMTTFCVKVTGDQDVEMNESKEQLKQALQELGMETLLITTEAYCTTYNATQSTVAQ